MTSSDGSEWDVLSASDDERWTITGEPSTLASFIAMISMVAVVLGFFAFMLWMIR